MSACPDVEELGGILELSADDPRRRHVESCRRCRLLVAAHERFLSVPPAPGAKVEDAADRLRRAFESELPAPARKRPALPRGRIGLAAAAAFAVAIAVVFTRPRPDAPDRPVFRGEGDTETSASRDVPRVEVIETLPDGKLRLRWSETPGASRYELRLYDANAREIARLPAVEGGTRVIGREDLPALVPGEELLGRIVARTDAGDSLASPYFTFRLP
ncbi:MAG: hypothetical protein ACT4PE_13440 [Candidatus Eiseniibacteriota bacterium]